MAKIIPPVLLTSFFVYQVANQSTIWERWRYRLFLFVALFLLFIFIIPFGKPSVELDARSHTAVFQYHPEQLFQAVFQNREGIEPERRSAFFSIENTLPSSLARTLGFFLLWPLVSIAIFLIWKGWRHQVHLEFRWIIAVVWLALAVAALGLHFQGMLKNERYLTTALVPLVIVTFSVFGKALLGLRRVEIRRALTAVMLLLIALRIQQNLDHVVFLRNFYGGGDITEYLAVKAIYEDKFGRQKPNWLELYNFYHGEPPARHNELLETRLKTWNFPDTEKLTQAVEAAAQKWHQPIYVVAEEPLADQATSSLVLFKRLSPWSIDSLYAKVMPLVKKKKGERFLYKYTSDHTF